MVNDSQMAACSLISMDVSGCFGFWSSGQSCDCNRLENSLWNLISAECEQCNYDASPPRCKWPVKEVAVWTCKASHDTRFEDDWLHMWNVSKSGIASNCWLSHQMNDQSFEMFRIWIGFWIRSKHVRAGSERISDDRRPQLGEGGETSNPPRGERLQWFLVAHSHSLERSRRIIRMNPCKNRYTKLARWLGWHAQVFRLPRHVRSKGRAAKRWSALTKCRWLMSDAKLCGMYDKVWRPEMGPSILLQGTIQRYSKGQVHLTVQKLSFWFWSIEDDRNWYSKYQENSENSWRKPSEIWSRWSGRWCTPSLSARRVARQEPHPKGCEWNRSNRSNRSNRTDGMGDDGRWWEMWYHDDSRCDVIIWIIYELYMNYIWIIYELYELYMNYIWIIYELYMNYIWIIYELYMNYMSLMWPGSSQVLVVCSDASARIYDRDGALAYLGWSLVVHTMWVDYRSCAIDRFHIIFLNYIIVCIMVPHGETKVRPRPFSRQS